MEKISTLLIGILVLVLVMAAPVFAGGGAGPASVAPDPDISAASLLPAVTTPAPALVVRYPVKVVTTTFTQQAAGTLTAGSIPAGASVYIDGTYKGTAPLTIRAIPAGVHAVTFRLAGYADYSTKVTITAGAVAKLVGTMTPGTPEVVTRTTSPSPSGTPRVPVPVKTDPPATTMSLAAIRSVQPVIPEQTGLCTKQFTGSGKVDTAPDGRLNCTTIISSDDNIASLLIQHGTLATDAGKRPLTEIHIVPVNPSEIPSVPVGTRWTGHAYHFLPDHASFNPPVLVSFTLSQPEWDRLDPANLTIMETSENGQGWETLPASLDPVKRMLSAPARHFSIIGLFSMGPAAEPPVSQQSPVEVIRTAARSSHTPLPLSPLIPDTWAPLAAVSAGITLSIAGAMAGGSTAVSQLWSRIFGIIQDFLGSEATGFMNTAEIEKRGIKPSENLTSVLFGISFREILVISISALGFAAAFMLQDRLEPELTTVVVFVCAGGIATILHDLAHKYSAWRRGCLTEYQFWGLGTVTMFVTAWLFGTAFAKPSRSLIRKGSTISLEEAGRIRLAGPLMSMGVAVASLVLIPLGGIFVLIGSAGFSMNLLNAVFSLLPVEPNDGVEIFAWNRLIWGLFFVPLLAFYLYFITFQ